MNYHVVRTNETIEKIASLYNLTIDEIKSINAHIRDWRKLIPGTKLRLPEIPETINDELEDVEPFIEDYYTKINLDEFKQKEHEFESPISPVIAKQEILKNYQQLESDSEADEPEEKETNKIVIPGPKFSGEQNKTKTKAAPLPQYPYYPYYPYGYYGHPVYYNPYQLGYRSAWPRPTYSSRKGQRPS